MLLDDLTPGARAIELRAANFHQPSIILITMVMLYNMHPSVGLRLGILAEVEYYLIQHPLDVGGK